VVGAGNVVMAAGLASPQDFGGAAVLVATLSQGIWMFLYVPWALVLLCFPAGRIEGRARWIAAVLVATAVVFTLVAPWAGPYDEPVTEHFRTLPTAAWAPAVGYPLVGLFMVCLLLCAVTGKHWQPPWRTPKRAANASCVPPTRNAAGWNVTCTTASSSNSWPWGCPCG